MAHQVSMMRAPRSRVSGFMHTYWSRGEAGRPTPRSLVVFMNRMWLLALLFKLLGSSWDVSWHFKWLRDDLAAAHILNTVGTGIAIGLVLAHTFTGYGADRRSLRIMQIGTGIFVVAGPIDVINHRVNGLDLTAWSPSHLLLYIGTAIMIAGVIRNWYHSFPREGRFAKQWSAGLIALWAFMFENTFFPTGQQEYGILEVESWLRGRPYAEPELLSFAAGQIGRPVDDIALETFAMPIKSWVYPVWVIGICVALLVFARLMVGRRWTATIVIALYVAYRCVIWPLLTFTIFPPSSVPLWLLPVGLAVDLMFLPRMQPYLRAVVGAAVLTAVGYGALALQAVAFGTPLALGSWTIVEMRQAFEAGANLYTVPVAWGTFWISFLLLAATWSAVTLLVRRGIGLDTRRPPAPVGYETEPERDARGVLTGWAAKPATSQARRTARPARTDRRTGERVSG
ncbi:hypothetical protein JL107_08155 [Nakamurella flavida]|uniref:Uncharacterized protein n=1 Tax=Nakamurella flavida TaxID=363630 RepID=A0A938YJQ9_9ACTN|nr:hypothetical protein [Nakamurella flavida]MBM9476409.1 hypothetical protein [Nakamurella flavida]MDP9779490.1 hypothetical protein [Nakamurella flavida]